VNPSTSGSNLWLFVEVLAKRRGLILGLVIGATAIALIVSLLLPKVYTAEALLLPPKNTTVPVAGLTRLAEVASATQGLSLPVMVTTGDVYTRMLRSRRVAGAIIDSFNLVESFDVQNRDWAYERLVEDVASFTVTEEGLLRIAVELRDPELAASIANAFVEELDQVNRRISSARARENRQFIQERLAQVEQELDSARAAFEAFQMRYQAVDFEEQTRLAVEQAIDLKVRLAETDIELQLLKSKVGADHADYQELLRRRKIIAQELQGLERRNPDSSFFSLPIASIPRLRGEYEELYSHVQVNESLYQTLLTHLEQAKLQEKEDLPTITVLDHATPPERKSGPRRAVIVLAAFFFSLVLAILIASWLEYLRRLARERPEDYNRIELFTDAFLGWLPGVGRKRKPSTSK
jgi:uncharacterized protein involved in exopolysaccharide biosynthesis